MYGKMTKAEILAEQSVLTERLAALKGSLTIDNLPQFKETSKSLEEIKAALDALKEIEDIHAKEAADAAKAEADAAAKAKADADAAAAKAETEGKTEDDTKGDADSDTKGEADSGSDSSTEADDKAKADDAAAAAAAAAETPTQGEGEAGTREDGTKAGLDADKIRETLWGLPGISGGSTGGGEIKSSLLGRTKTKESNKLGNDVDQNNSIIRAAVRSKALSMSAKKGEICGPAEPYREIRGCYASGTPVFDMFANFNVYSKNGIQFSQAKTLDQFAPQFFTGITPKICEEDKCIDNTTVKIDLPIYICRCIDILTQYSSEQAWADTINGMEAALDRAIESYILFELDQYSHYYDVAPTEFEYGSVPTLVDLVSRIRGMLNQINRTSNSYSVIWEQSHIDNLILDELSRCNGSTQGAREAVFGQIADLGFASSVITNDWAIDPAGALTQTPLFAPGELPSAVGLSTPQTLPPRRTDFRVRFVPLDAFGTMEIPRIDFRAERDSNLALQNKVMVFMERFVKLVHLGCAPSFSIDATFCPSGARGGCVTPFTCTDDPRRLEEPVVEPVVESTPTKASKGA